MIPLVNLESSRSMYISGFVKSHPVLGYYFVTFAISWGCEGKSQYQASILKCY